MRTARYQILSLTCVVANILGATGCGSTSVQKPPVITFGSSLAEIEQNLTTQCDEIRTRNIEPVQLPGVEKQSQIECSGFDYFGASRLAEFVFADNALILTWILVDVDDVLELENAFIRNFGAPAFKSETITGFHDAHAAVRKDIPEALYYAPSVADIVQTRMTQ